MSRRRPLSPHAGARDDAATGASPSSVPAPRTPGRPGAGRTAAGRVGAARASRVTGGRSGRGASTRPASRSVAGASARDTGAAAEAPVRIPRMFTVRAMVLFVVLMLAFVLLFPTVRAHLAQQAENRQLAGEVAAARERTEDLDAELDRWDDPAYVAAQARERLGFVRPGETAYRVVDPEIVPDPTEPSVPAAGSGPALVPEGTTAPWYTTIWESVRVAGEAKVADPAAGPAAGDAPPTP
jgi:cell division protein FtsB